MIWLRATMFFLLGLVFLAISFGGAMVQQVATNGTTLPGVINSNTILEKANSPYIANSNVTVNSGILLTVEPGVVIQFAKDAGLYIHGELQMIGIEEDPVTLEKKPGHANWDILSLVNPSGACNIEYVNISGTTVGDNPGREQAAITAYKADNLLISHVTLTDNFEPIRIVSCDDVTVQYCTFSCDKAGADFINFAENSSGVIQFCEFIGNDKKNCDAIDFDFSTATIEGNIIHDFSGDNSDGIDIGGDDSDVLITGNLIWNMSDKGISIGEQSKAQVERNIVYNSVGGIVAKDLAVVNALNNTVCFCEIGLYGTSNPEVNYGGGVLHALNTVIYDCEQSTASDHNSTLTVKYSISNERLMTGTGNIHADPMLTDPANSDFSLKPNSPAIDSGDPESNPDPDGTRADMGAIPFEQEGYYKLAITEINYRPIINGNEDDSFEFFEIYNNDDEPADLTGYSIMGAVNHTFINETILEGHEYLLMVKSASQFDLPDINVQEWDSGKLNNQGETFFIVNPDEIAILEFAFESVSPWPSLPNGFNYTIELKDVELSYRDPTNWRISYQPGGSPGQPNVMPYIQEGIVINELTAKSGTYHTDENGNYSDWIEIYNKGDAAINIGGLYLSNDMNNRDLYFIPDEDPERTTMLPGQFIIIYADEDASSGIFHTNFTLKSGGGVVVLSQKRKTVLVNIDELNYPAQAINISYGRFPDGGYLLEYFGVPSPGAGNVRAEEVIIDHLYINEIASKVEYQNPDEHGFFSDWIELYNGGDNPVQLSGLWFSDVRSDLFKHQISEEFPDSVSIEPGGFFVLRADQRPDLGINHLDFKLASMGESVIIMQDLWGYHRIVDSISFPAMQLDVSYGRITDGNNDWQSFEQTTPGRSNSTSAVILEPFPLDAKILVTPNPINKDQPILIRGDWSFNKNYNIRVLNSAGHQIVEKRDVLAIPQVNGNSYLQLIPDFVSHLSDGIVFFVIYDEKNISVSKAVVIN